MHFSRRFLALLAALALPLVICNLATAAENGAIKLRKKHLTQLNQIESTNWAGYEVTPSPLSISSIQGTWTVPTIAASSTNTASATWLGIGGGCVDPPSCLVTEPTLIQAGTEEDNTSGTQSYSAWWEALPAPSEPLSGGPISSGGSYDVAPGDVVTVTISASPNVLWSIALQDVRSGSVYWTFDQTVPYVEAGLTAEWIEESPLEAGTGGAGQLPLSDFGQITFSGLEINGAAPTLNAEDELIMTNSSGTILAQPSAPQGDGFTVCYGSGACQ
jgi:Peptidase A4 family